MVIVVSFMILTLKLQKIDNTVSILLIPTLNYLKCKVYTLNYIFILILILIIIIIIKIKIMTIGLSAYLLITEIEKFILHLEIIDFVIFVT